MSPPFPPLPSYFTWAQARDLGLTRWGLTQLLHQGRLRRPFRDVYVDASLADTVDTRLAVVRLVLPEHAVIVDRTAAWVWGVDTLQHWELEYLPRLEIFVRRGHKRLSRAEAGGGTRDLHDRDLVEIGGTSVTTPLRTALDLCCRLPRYSALAAADALAREHSLDPSVMARELVRFRGRRGVVQARALVSLVDPGAESPGESITRLAIVETALPAPVAQYWVLDDEGGRRYRLDLAYPRLKICIEYDGEEFHTSTEQRAADERRRAWLRTRGWRVIVVRKRDLGAEARGAWLSELHQAYADRTVRR